MVKQFLFVALLFMLSVGFADAQFLKADPGGQALTVSATSSNALMGTIEPTTARVYANTAQDVGQVKMVAEIALFVSAFFLLVLLAFRHKPKSPLLKQRRDSVSSWMRNLLFAFRAKSELLK
jgi:hypothetical protein